jgi:hypothetical protein
VPDGLKSMQKFEGCASLRTLQCQQNTQGKYPDASCRVGQRKGWANLQTLVHRTQKNDIYFR